ncbi:MAG: hypothetical protein AAGC44_10550 [Planctomycetota bacterium]
MPEDDATPIDLAPDGPKPGEPSEAHLRRDIADELTDHLELSAKAKQIGGASQKLSKEHAIKAFGNPDALAWRLYFDAMKGNIMRQNIQAGAVTVIALVVVLLGISIFYTMRANHEALLEGLAGLQPQPVDAPANLASPVSMEWRRVVIKLVDSEGQPIETEDYRCTISGYLLQNEQETHLSEDYTPGEAITIGPIRVGKHEVKVYSPNRMASTRSDITVMPGPYDQVIRVACPKPDKFSQYPQVMLNIPEDLALVGLSARVKLDQSGYGRYGKNYWANQDLYYLIDMDGREQPRLVFGGGCDSSDGSITLTDPKTSKREQWEYDRINFKPDETTVIPFVSCFPEQFVLYWDVGGLLSHFESAGHRLTTLGHAALNDPLNDSSITAQYDPATNTIRIEGSNGFWEAVRDGIDPDIMTQIRARHEKAKVARGE